MIVVSRYLSSAGQLYNFALAYRQSSKGAVKVVRFFFTVWRFPHESPLALYTAVIQRELIPSARSVREPYFEYYYIYYYYNNNKL